MRLLVIIGCLMAASASFGSGPKWTYPENPKLDDEMQNVYHDIRVVPNGVYKASSMTIQGITVDSETVKYRLDMNSQKILNVANGTAATDAAAFGQIPTAHFLQVVTCTATGATTVASTSFADTALSCAITPGSSSSKVLILVTSEGETNSGDTGQYTLNRAGTDLNSGTGLTEFAAPAAGYFFPVAITYLDSPATTSATTYKLRLKSRGGGSERDNINNVTATMTLAEVQ